MVEMIRNYRNPEGGAPSAKRRIAGGVNNAARTNNAAMLARKERSNGTAIVRLGAIASLPKRYFCNYLFP